MSEQLFKKLERSRKRHGLSILALCKQIGCNNVTYHRWKKSRQITGPYKKIVEEFLDKNESHPQHPATIPSDIAVIGIACYYPGAHNVKELWENILARRVQFRRILDQRLPLKDYYNEDPKFPDTTYLTKAAFIDGFEFNWPKLRIPRKTFESTDVVHWLALDTALKTFEDAGYKPDKIPLQNTGVILGNTLTGEQTRSLTLRLRWPYVRKTLNATLESFGIREEERSRLSEAMEKVYKSAFFPITEDSLSGGLANTIAGRICNYLNLKGGGYIVDGACSSSLLAVATAANALKLREMDLALAGGVDISLDPFELVGFSKVGALAKDQMRVYDQRASGFVPGEGCGFVLLKRLEDAVKDKDYIYAVIKGWGISSDGKGGIMEPSSVGQATAIQRAYRHAGYTIANVDFIEGHGTGTIKGDRVELCGIATALKMVRQAHRKEAAKKMNGRICGITSFKSIVGHTKAAAGIGGFIKAVLAVNQRILPPTASCQQPNEVFEKEAKQLYPLINGRIYSLEKKVRAGISSAGFGGINCHITVESKDNPDEKIKPNIDERALFVSNQNTEVFVFASRTILLLRKLIQKFKEDLRNISMAEMADLSARLNKKVKAQAPIKIAVVTDSPEHLYEALCAVEKELESDSLTEGQILEVKSQDSLTYILLGNRVKNNRIGFLYSGQGAQRLNMTRTLVERFSWARDLMKITKISIGEYIYRPEDQFLAKEEKEQFRKKLSQTEITQPAIAFSSLVWTEFLSKLGIEPEAVGGHSLGELLAFYKGGAFDKKTLLKFAELRGRLMAGRAKSAGMVSLFCDYSQAEKLVGRIKGNIVISNINSPNQTVVSGGTKEIAKVIEFAKAENISTYILPVSNAFHSLYMQGASQKIQSAQVLGGAFRPGKIDVYSCIDGVRIENQVNLREYFSKQVLLPVNFIKLIESVSERCDLFIEVGPGRILTDLVKTINKNKGPECFPLEGTPQNDRDLNIVLAQVFIRNVKINWQELYRNRAIKPFIPVSRRKFIENQCERPLKGAEQKEMLFSELTVPIQSHLPLPRGEGRGEGDRRDTTTPTSILPPQGGGDIGFETTFTGNADAIADVLIDLTHKVTGFDVQSLNLNLRLLDDLNLDSIKAAELIAEAGKILGLTGQIDPSQYSNNTLAQIRDRLAELKSQTPQTVGGAADNVLHRYQRNTWVRNFVVRFEEEKIKQSDPAVFKRLNKIDILTDESQRGIAYKLKQSLKDKKAEVRIKTYDELDKTQTEAVGLICILPTDHNNGGPLGENGLKRIINNLYHIMAAVTLDGTDKDPSTSSGQEKTVVFVQFGGGNFGENDKVRNIESCCARSFASTLHLERPDLRVRVLDFNKDIPADSVSDKIVEELQTQALFSIAGYDKNLIRRAPVFHNTQPALYKKRDIQWTPKDVVLVTGGAKGITAECALEFARKTKAQMVLVGRSELPPQAKDQDNEIIRTLNRFKEEKLKCQYYSCDVTNFEAVRQLISKIEQSHGEITAVIHGAGQNTLKRLKQSNPEEAYHEALPKVMGAINICKALEKNSLKLIAGITSVIGVTGMEGSGWYGLANEVLNLFLHQFKAMHKETDVVTIAYSVWDEIGMGTKLGSLDWLLQKGISPIPVAEGVKRFMQLIEGDSGSQQTIVVARIAGIDTWRSPQTNFRNGLRFIEDIKYCMPGVELIAQAYLNIKDDPYLLDHNWKGTLLFPFVFGLEAMTQAAVFLTGRESIDALRVNDVHLDKPIPVNQDNGAKIEIHAEVRGRENVEEVQRVKVEIYSEQTGYKEPHFSAILELDEKTQSSKPDNHLKSNSKNVLNINPVTDLYGPILFQGKLFQCINKIYKLFYNEKTHKGECLLTLGQNRSTYQFLKSSPKFNKHFLIGDPFFIDSILQSIQLIIPQDLSLPRRIEGIDINVSSFSDDLKECVVHSYIHKINNEQGIGYAETFNVKVRNCDLKILQTILDRPSANDLVNSAKRDKRIIKEKLNGLSQELGFTPPIVQCLSDPGLKSGNKEERHKIELPLIRSAVKELLKRENKHLANFSVKWDKFGKPIVAGKGLKDINVSLSHDGDLLLVVAGCGEQGCDIETIPRKTKSEWLILLGENKYRLLEKVNEKSGDINNSGTAVWSAIETAQKSYNSKHDGLEYLENKQDIFLFKINEDSNDRVLGLPIKLTLGEKRIVALLISLNRNNPSKNNRGLELISGLGYNQEIFSISGSEDGPQGQMVYIQRFPVTFKCSQALSRKVYFTNYFNWIGEIREHGLYPIMNKISQMAETGGWGLATNSVKTKILGELRSHDIVEVRLWLEKISGLKEGTFDFVFEWRKVLSADQYERVAISKLRSTWIQITGHGEAMLGDLPDFIKDFMDSMNPRSNVVKPLPSLPEPLKDLSRGRKLFDYASNKLFIAEERFKTTLEDSNLVGNIYFANYPKWLGRVIDSYFYKLIPDYFSGIGQRGELLCLNCEIEHLREAMPFDNIVVCMYLERLFECGMDMYFEYYKLRDDKSLREKLSFAYASLVWVKRAQGQRPIASVLPTKILENLRFSSEI